MRGTARGTARVLRLLRGRLVSKAWAAKALGCVGWFELMGWTWATFLVLFQYVFEKISVDLGQFFSFVPDFKTCWEDFVSDRSFFLRPPFRSGKRKVLQMVVSTRHCLFKTTMDSISSQIDTIVTTTTTTTTATTTTTTSTIIIIIIIIIIVIICRFEGPRLNFPVFCMGTYPYQPKKDLFRSVKGKNLHPSSLLHFFPSFDFVDPRCKWQRSHQPGALSTILVSLVPTRSHISYRRWRQRQRRRSPWQGQSRSHRLKRKRIGSVGAVGAVGTPRNQSKFGAEELLMLKNSLPSHRTARTETDAAIFELIFQILLLKKKWSNSCWLLVDLKEGIFPSVLHHHGNFVACTKPFPFTSSLAVPRNWN